MCGSGDSSCKIKGHYIRTTAVKVETLTAV